MIIEHIRSQTKKCIDCFWGNSFMFFILIKTIIYPSCRQKITNLLKTMENPFCNTIYSKHRLFLDDIQLIFRKEHQLKKILLWKIGLYRKQSPIQKELQSAVLCKSCSKNLWYRVLLLIKLKTDCPE